MPNAADPTNVVPSDAPSLYAALSRLQQQALVLPNNVPPGGIAGFVFDVPGEDTLQLESDITDHWVEDNTSIQDQIALAPERITLRGTSAELSYTAVFSLPQQSSLLDPLPLNAPLVPVLTPGAQQTLDQQNAVDQDAGEATVGVAQSLYDYYKAQTNGGAGTTKQSGVVGYFYQLWLGRMVFTIQTPWGIWENMAIEAMRAVQPEDDRFHTEFEVRFKKLRFANDLISPQSGTLAGRADNQLAEASPTQLGNAGLQTVSAQQSGQILQNWTLLGSLKNNG